MAVSDWSTTPANNTSLGTVNLSEGATQVGDFNGAFRQAMADIRVMYDGLPNTSTLQTKAAAIFSGTQPTYTGRGAYLHHNGATLTSGRIFLQASGGTTPAGMLPGDLLLEY